MKTKNVRKPAPSGARAKLDRIIQQTIPRRQEQAWIPRAGVKATSVFQFARALKGLAKYRTLPVHRLKPIVKQWYIAARSNLHGESFEQTWANFVLAWEDVKKPKGQRLEAIIKRAKRAKSIAGLDSFPPRVQLLARIIRERQRETPGESFPLSTRSLAEVLGVGENGFVTVSRDLLLLRKVNPPLLKLTTQGGRVKGQPSRASTYRYLGKL